MTDTTKLLIDMLRSGYSQTDSARMVGCTRARAQQVAKKIGVDTRGAKKRERQARIKKENKRIQLARELKEILHSFGYYRCSAGCHTWKTASEGYLRYYGGKDGKTTGYFHCLRCNCLRAKKRYWKDREPVADLSSYTDRYNLRRELGIA